MPEIVSRISQSSVSHRINLFYLRYPTGRLVTELVSDSGERIVFRAFAYRWSTDRLPASTGWGVEPLDKQDRLLALAFQRAESCAVSRALANLGFADQQPPNPRTPTTGLPPHTVVRLQPQSRHEPVTNKSHGVHHDSYVPTSHIASLVMAERYGLSSRRSAILRAALEGISTTDAARQERIARLIRQWITARKLRTLDDRLRRFSR
jgi:hypothetical protein